MGPKIWPLVDTKWAVFASEMLLLKRRFDQIFFLLFSVVWGSECSVFFVERRYWVGPEFLGNPPFSGRVCSRLILFSAVEVPLFPFVPVLFCLTPWV